MEDYTLGLQHIISVADSSVSHLLIDQLLQVWSINQTLCSETEGYL